MVEVKCCVPLDQQRGLTSTAGLPVAVAASDLVPAAAGDLLVVVVLAVALMFLGVPVVVAVALLLLVALGLHPGSVVVVVVVVVVLVAFEPSWGSERAWEPSENEAFHPS